MSRETLTHTTDLVVVTCWCGTPHAVPEELRDYQLRQHENGGVFSIYCPHGHAYHPSGEGKAARLKRQLERAEAEAQQRLVRLEDERRQHAATKAKLTRARQRAAATACPVEGCTRTFTSASMARDIASKHPDFVP